MLRTTVLRESQIAAIVSSHHPLEKQMVKANNLNCDNAQENAPINANGTP